MLSKEKSSSICEVDWNVENILLPLYIFPYMVRERDNRPTYIQRATFCPRARPPPHMTQRLRCPASFIASSYAYVLAGKHFSAADFRGSRLGLPT